MKRKIMIVTMLIGLALCIPTHVNASTGTVKSQAQLEKLLVDESTDIIKIATKKESLITVPSGDYNKKLIINIPNGCVVNSGKFSEITVKNAIKYTENVKGNSLNITDNKLTVNVSKGASMKNISVSNKNASIRLVADGNVNKLTIDTARVVGIHGTHNKVINVISNYDGVKLNISSLVTFVTNIEQLTDSTKADIERDDSISEKSNVNIETELETVKQNAYNKAYSNWMSYFATQYQKTINNSSTNTSVQTDNQTKDEAPSITAPSAIIPVEDPVIETEEPSEPVVNYQMTFTHWNDSNAFTTYTGRCQYVYISNTEDSVTPLEGTEWQIAVVSNNEDSTDESLVWTDLNETTCIGGVADSTYYRNAYKLTFNESGRYYLRAKHNDQYVYSMPITVNADNTTYLETEIDGNMYMTQAHVSKNNATFKYTGCTPEEIDTLANVTYIKYKNSSTLHRGLYVNHVRTDLNSHSIYYTFKKCDEYNSSGALSQTAIYNDSYKPLQVDSYSNGVLTKSRVMTYDEFGRTYTTITINYDTDGNVTSKSGYYYTYDENGKQTRHSGIPAE